MSLYLLILAFITSCGNINDTAKTDEMKSEKVLVLSEIEDDFENQTMLIGKFIKEDLQQAPYARWFNDGYTNFNPSEEAMETIKNNISEYEIMAFMGTWCVDSRREVPKLYKILDEAGYDLSKLTFIGVDRNKVTPEKTEADWDLHRVPTLIFMKDGKEVNRFVEYPRASIEEDIANIVSGQEYNNSYIN
ncbi:thioredoxin family protein [Gillisia sp. Q332]|uniref:thioredoxin family protein n=1 Tax=Gillisia xinjiangensis TaxID=3384765 RepID=UPI00391DB931